MPYLNNALGAIPTGPRYWAAVANPRRFRIDEALDHLKTDSWTTRGKPVRTGDKVLIWRASGGKGSRGIVALGKVTADPVPMADDDNPYWVTRPTSIEPRAIIRFYRPPGLPLWVGGPADSVLQPLSACRARGGTVFHVTPDQWNAITAFLGGDPTENPETDDAASTISNLAGKPPPTRGFRTTPEQRRAIESHAMARAIAHFRSVGWDVHDVSASCSYDLHCTRLNEPELHVEVKGTTSIGAEVLLTPAEVVHARAYFPNTALFVLANLATSIDAHDGITVSGGTQILIHPWRPTEDSLTPIGYTYTLPRPMV